MPFKMVPVVPEPPNQVEYPTAALNLFPRMTRALFLQTFGEEAPDWDKTQRIKRWADTSLLDNPNIDPDTYIVPYMFFDVDSQNVTTVKRMTMTARQAAAINLPGLHSYPKFINPSTSTAVIISPEGDRSPMGGDQLSTADQAKVLLADFPGSTTAQNGITGYSIQWNDEQRRNYEITFNGDTHNVALMIKQRYAQGVGSPGHWVMTGSSPVWVSEVLNQEPQDLRPEIPMPIRALKPFETIKSGIFSGALIHRTDLQDPNAPAPSGGAGLTAEQDARLKDIQKKAGQILALQTGVAG